MKTQFPQQSYESDVPCSSEIEKSLSETLKLSLFSCEKGHLDAIKGIF